MPLLYGEEKKAFARLQQEVVTTSDDESILAWDLACEGKKGLHSAGLHLFAPSVRFFSTAGGDTDQNEDDKGQHRCPSHECSAKFFRAVDLQAHVRRCGLNTLLEQPRPFTMDNRGLHVRRVLLMYDERDEKWPGKRTYFVMLNVSKDWTTDNSLLLRIRASNGDWLHTSWLQKGKLNYVVCDREKLYSRRELDYRYCSETVDEYELLILKHKPVQRE